MQSVYFNPDLFVNREPEKQLWRKVLEGKEGIGRFFEFTGIAGQGKSELLKYFYTASKEKEKFISVYLDFDKRKFYRPEIYPVLEEITAFLREDAPSEDIFSQFDSLLKEYLEVFRSYQSQLWKEPETAHRRPVDKKEEELIEAFKEDFARLLDKNKYNYKIALCFDSTERTYPAAMQQVEEYIFQPFIKNENLILVFAGQQRWTWTLRELRRQIKRHSLSPLSKEDSSLLIDTLLSQENITAEDREALLEKMWELTLGHPFSSYKFLDFLSDGFNRESLTKTIIDEYYRPSIKELINKVIKHRILERLELNPAYPEPETVLSYLAPLRRIEFSTFHFILSRFLPECFKGKPFLFFEELIAEFQKQSHIFTPWILGAGFDVEPVTRNILLADLRLNQKEKFLEIQQALIEQYEYWIDQTRDASQIKNIIERLYHRILFMKEEQKEDNIYETISKELKEFIDRIKQDAEDPIQIRDQITRLKNALERDKELNDMIAVQKLVNIIEEA